jgi:hypothetical protein
MKPTHILAVTNSVKEPETLDWKEAAKLWSEGVKLQLWFENSWQDFDDAWTAIFSETRNYRRKPVSVIEKTYRAFFKDGYLSSHFDTLEECEEMRPAKFYLELTYTDKIPTGARVIGKDQD